MKLFTIFMCILLAKTKFQESVVILDKPTNDCPEKIKNKYPFIIVAFNDSVLHENKYLIPNFTMSVQGMVTGNKKIIVPQIQEGLWDYNISYHSYLNKSIHIKNKIFLEQTSILKRDYKTKYEVGIVLTNGQWRCTFIQN